MESVNKLEHSEIKVKVIPFEVRTTKIKSVKEKDFQNVNSRGSLKMEVIKQTLETEGIMKRSALISESDALSISSGFDGKMKYNKINQCVISNFVENQKI
jgi:uncharacterized protein (DUF39 family)